MRRRLPLALFFLGAGIMHFVKPRAYEATVPDALNGAFGTDAFKPGLLIGTAVVRTRATPRR